jgi:SAM-dependent methyltransferase
VAVKENLMHTGNYLGNIMIQLTQEDIETINTARQTEMVSITPHMEIIDCPLCQHNNAKHLIGEQNKGKLGRCSNCNVAYAYERPASQLTNALYRYYIPSNLTDVEIRKSQLETRPKELNDDLDCLELHTKRGSLLDVGASSGDFLVYARLRGWDVEATELSEICADFMATTLNIPVLLGNILDIKFENKYTAITLRHCIEHLREPVEELKVLHDVLEDNGTLFITTPEHAKNLKVLKANHMLPLHIVNYTRDTLEFLLSKAGFKILTYESQKNHTGIDNMKVTATKEC